MIKLTLQSYVALYVPTTVHLNQPTDTMQYVQCVQVKFCNWFGGATTQQVTGDYMPDGDSECVHETIYIVRSFCTTAQLEEHFLSVVELGEWLCHELDQESITCERNGKMFFIDRNEQ